MPSERHQLNLRPEHYIIYIRIKEEKEAKITAAEPDTVLARKDCHAWCPSQEASIVCASLHLNDELLVTRPDASTETLGGLDLSHHSDSFTNIYNMKRAIKEAT